MNTLDWLVVMVFMGVVLGAAIYARQFMQGVSDFLAAGRCAGRYVIANAKGEAGMAVVAVVANFEVFYKAGFTMGFWEFLALPVGMFISLLGWVIYRYRETRALTLAQFFEIRYSRKFRIFAGILAFVSGILNYGVFPAVAARFFVFFCQLPQTFYWGGIPFSTVPVIMFIYLTISVTMTLTGGQLTILITDSIEGILSMFGFGIVIIVLMVMFRWDQMYEALTVVAQGQSMVDPFDTREISDFNIWFVLIGLLGSIYNTMAWQGGHAFNSSALNAHEAKMAGIISNWRGYGKALFTSLLALCAYTYMKHPDFAGGALEVEKVLKTASDPQVANQMRLVAALGVLLPVGIKGLVCGLMLMALIACDGSYLHSWGSIFIQDVVLPLRKKPFESRQHIVYLRLAVVGVALFGFCFALLFRQTDYIRMFFAITGAIFLGGAGATIIGGLYWKRGTTAGAWAAMLMGAGISVGGILLQQPVIWQKISIVFQWIHSHFQDGFLNRGNISGGVGAWPAKFPINSQWLFLISMASACGSYVIVSLCTGREGFNMDRMLHRGPYAMSDHETVRKSEKSKKWSWSQMIGITSEFTKTDKAISISVFSWKLVWVIISLTALFWNFVSRWPTRWWAEFWYFKIIIIPIILCLITTVWFTWGGVIDLKKLFQTLRTTRRSGADDGTVVGHQNRGEYENGMESNTQNH